MKSKEGNHIRNLACKNGHPAVLTYEMPEKYVDEKGIGCDDCKKAIDLTEGYYRCEGKGEGDCENDWCGECASGVALIKKRFP